LIELYYDTTPNARKILIMLEEVGADYTIVWTDISKGEQFTDFYRAVNPNAKIPAIIDREGPGCEPFALFESGAILIYLAEKYGRLLSSDRRERHLTLAWVFWQVGGQGPMSGQATHFVSHAPKVGIDLPYARDRYVGETRRHYDVLEIELAKREYLVGDFSIADIAAFPWTRVAKGHGVDLAEYPNVKRWSNAIAQRPSAKARPEDAKGVARGHGYQGYDRAQWDVLFGKGQGALAAKNAAGG
jgi:GSH-dependent disulfide-bond oxidoreductase